MASKSTAAIDPRATHLTLINVYEVADADDVVQDACLCWLATDHDAVRQPAALLRTIGTRLCLNELNSVRRKRETYIGPWLPEPIVEGDETDSADDITLPLNVTISGLNGTPGCG